MIINSSTGNLLIGTESIGPTLSETDFLKSVLGASAVLVRETAVTTWYESWLLVDSGREVGIVTRFERNGRIQRARIKFVKSETRAAGVLGWSKEVENEMKEFHDCLLRQCLGRPPYDFPWGRITSVIDQHSYSAIIIVAYGL